jgi:hypothetical protein
MYLPGDHPPDGKPARNRCGAHCGHRDIRMGVLPMCVHEWLPVPIGIGAERWITRAGCRTVLVVVHTVTSGQRLLDVVDYVESDPRIQTVFTIAPDTFRHGVPRFLHQLDALVLPWEQVVRERFDLALAAAHGGLPALHAPLMLMAHGAGHGKLTRPGPYGGPVLDQLPVYGLDAERLTRDGRVLASALLLALDGEREVLRRQCPSALGAAVVAGDPCFDRLVASLPERDRYRRALGVAAGQELVVVSSTWGHDGLFGSAPDLLPRLMDQLPPARFRVGALLHPAVWSAHGARQIRAWTRDCHTAGLMLLDPMEDWRAMLVAADYVVGDHGSVTAYAAAVGRPVLRLASASAPGIASGSAQELVLAGAARLDPARPLLPQLRAARPLDATAIAGALTSRPGQANRLIRQAMYRILRLGAPGRHRQPTPVPAPATRPAVAA